MHAFYMPRALVVLLLAVCRVACVDASNPHKRSHILVSRHPMQMYLNDTESSLAAGAKKAHRHGHTTSSSSDAAESGEDDMPKRKAKNSKKTKHKRTTTTDDDESERRDDDGKWRRRLGRWINKLPRWVRYLSTAVFGALSLVVVVALWKCYRNRY